VPRRLHTDITPLRQSPGFRIIFTSRTVTLFGSQASEVALLVQARQLTHSPAPVGLLGLAELGPLIVFGLYGGALADRFDRRALLRWCEAGQTVTIGLLLVNALLPRPAIWPLYALAAASMGIAALQRPSFDASVPRLVSADQLTAAAALMSVSANTGVIIGASLGGVLATSPGPWLVYALHAGSLVVSFVVLGRLRLPHVPASQAEPAGGVLDGIRYARRRPDLIGSYLADLAAMTFGYPNALIPFMAVALRAPWSAGIMFAATSVGALVISAVSGWMTGIRRHGLAIAVAATAWGVAIIGFGLAPDVPVAVTCLLVAGAADEISVIFRDTVWNQTIPDSVRGRMAGVELLSYAIGPSAGQIRSGVMASLGGPRFSLVSGGVLCGGCVAIICAALPAFTRYRAPAPATDASPAANPGSAAANPGSAAG
jgi:MFS family permease